MECGLYGDILNLNYKHLVMDGCWFKNLWELLSHLGVKLDINEEFHLCPLPEGDSPILAELAAIGYEGVELARLSCVAHFKAVVHLLDLVNCNGKLFDLTMLDDTPGLSPGKMHWAC